MKTILAALFVLLSFTLVIGSAAAQEEASPAPQEVVKEASKSKETKEECRARLTKEYESAEHNGNVDLPETLGEILTVGCSK